MVANNKPPPPGAQVDRASGCLRLPASPCADILAEHVIGAARGDRRGGVDRSAFHRREERCVRAPENDYCV